MGTPGNPDNQPEACCVQSISVHAGEAERFPESLAEARREGGHDPKSRC